MALDSKIAPAHEGRRSREPQATTDGPPDKATGPSLQRKGRKKKRSRRKKGTYSDATTMHSPAPATPVVSYSELPDNSEDSTAPDSKPDETDISKKKDSTSQTVWEEHSWNTRDPFESMPTATLEAPVPGKAIVANTSSSEVEHTKCQTQASIPRTDGEPYTSRQEQAPHGERGFKDIQEQARAHTELHVDSRDQDNQAQVSLDYFEDDVDDEEAQLLPSAASSAAGTDADSNENAIVPTPGANANANANASAEVDEVGENVQKNGSLVEPDPFSPPRPHRNSEQAQDDASPGSSHFPSIWSAVRKGDTAGVRVALAAGAAVDEGDKEGRTPLMVACAMGDESMAALLLREASPRASVAARTMEGWTPLMVACGGGKLGVVKLLVAAGAGMRDKDSVFGSNPLMWACGGGHAHVVRYLLEHGAAELLESSNSDMNTPLMVACDAGSLEVAQILVEAGANVGAYNKEGRTAVDIVGSRNHLVVECYLRGEGANSSAEFWDAADGGDEATVSRLLKTNGHLVSAMDAHGRTALLLACVGLHLGLAKTLVEAGADVDFQDSSGTCPLSVAVVLGDLKLARYLVQAGGASVSLKNEAGWTPLMQAVAKGDLKMARYLVDRGAAVNEGTAGGDSVLDLARRFSQPELQRYLETKGGFSLHEVKRQIGEVNGGERGVFRLW